MVLRQYTNIYIFTTSVCVSGDQTHSNDGITHIVFMTWDLCQFDFGYTEQFCIPGVTSVFISSCDSVVGVQPVCCSMSSSNCCFLTCIQVSQEVGQVVWYSHLFQNFPQFIVIHTVKGFSIVNKAEIDVFLELSCSR